MQLEGEDWGLSYNSNHPLDMRYDKETMNTTCSRFSTFVVYITYEKLNEAPTYQLREIISRFGEEPAAEHITRVIVREREEKKIETASDLKNIIFNNMSSRVDKYKVLMRVSQALRIAINGELENLEDFMDNILIPLKKDGLGIVIAFHSLERQIISTRIKELVRYISDYTKLNNYRKRGSRYGLSSQICHLQVKRLIKIAGQSLQNCIASKS